MLENIHVQDSHVLDYIPTHLSKPRLKCIQARFWYKRIWIRYIHIKITLQIVSYRRTQIMGYTCNASLIFNFSQPTDLHKYSYKHNSPKQEIKFSYLMEMESQRRKFFNQMPSRQEFPTTNKYDFENIAQQFGPNKF